jgi:hypothetical protein
MIGKNPKPLSDSTWLRFLKSEHSPIRIATYRIDMLDIQYWVSVHFTRHKIGVEHFVSSCRDDITGKKRSPDDKVNHIMVINAQALVSMMRKRLCHKASKETREVAQCIVLSMTEIDDRLAFILKPDCAYRGKCNEIVPCGMYDRL